MNFGAPAVSITRLADSDLTLPEVDGSRFYLKVDIILPIYMASHPIILKSHSYLVIKNLCAPDDHSKNAQKYFKLFQSLTMITYFELGILDGVSVSLVSPWPWRSAANQSD
jgi:hypothetical protein